MRRLILSFPTPGMKLGDNRNKKEDSSEEERLQNRGAFRRSFDAIVGGLWCKAEPSHDRRD